jgi:hypothetical protein
MKFFRLDLLTLLISLFILNSCKNPDGVGLDVDPSKQLDGTMLVDSNVLLNTMLEDSVITTSQSRTPLAYFNDPELGETLSNIVTNINLPNKSAYTIPEGTISIDSAVLSLKYTAGGFYGDTIANLANVFKAEIFKVSEKPIAGRAYYSTKHWSETGSPLAVKTFRVRVKDSIIINEIVKGKADTNRKIPPQLRIKIDTNFIRSTLFTAGNHIKTHDAFQNAIKGLYIKMDKAGTTGAGGIVTFGLADTISVYIRVKNGSTIDSSVVFLPIDNKIADIRFNHSTAVTDAISSTTPNTKAYVQGLGGLRSKVSFAELKDNAELKNAIINRAELVVQPVPGTTILYPALPRLTMYKFDLAKQRTFIEDAADQSSGFGGLFGGLYGVPIKNEYRFLLTTYVQNLVSGKTQDYGTFIAAASEADLTTISFAATGYPIARTILFGKNSPYRLRLNIIYTKIK